MRRLIVLLAVGALLAVPATTLAATGGSATYDVHFAAMNGSGAWGSGTLTLTGDQLTVDLSIGGVLPDQPHAQHIHGFTDTKRGTAECPPAGFDPNNNGFTDVGEGGLFYGGFVNSLTTSGDTSPASALALDRMPVASAAGAYDYVRTFTIDRSVLMPLQHRVLVVHGLDTNGNGVYDNLMEATLPVLCGRISVAPAQ